MKPVGYCPNCEQVTEWDAMPTSPRLHKCCNCWHYVDDDQLKRASSMHDELIAHEEKRNAIIAANR